MGKKVKSTQKGGRSQDGEGQPPEESRREEDGNADTTERQSGGARVKTEGAPPQSLQVFVSGLPYETNEAQLRGFFDQ